jgi:hypothetical protein
LWVNSTQDLNFSQLKAQLLLSFFIFPPQAGALLLQVSHSHIFPALFISVRKMKPERSETKTVRANSMSEFFCFSDGEFSERPEMNTALILWLLSYQEESNA